MSENETERPLETAEDQRQEEEEERRDRNAESDVVVTRDAAGRFEPGNPFRFARGQSGNPRGRPRGIQREVQEFLSEKVPKEGDDRTFARALIERLAQTASQGGSAGVAATRELLDRGFGRVPLALKLGGDEDASVTGEPLTMRVVGEAKTPRARQLKENADGKSSDIPE